MITVKIQKEEFNPQKILINAEKDKKYGALVSFIGSVREETNNGKVKKLFIEKNQRIKVSFFEDQYLLLEILRKEKNFQKEIFEGFVLATV